MTIHKSKNKNYEKVGDFSTPQLKKKRIIFFPCTVCNFPKPQLMKKKLQLKKQEY